MKVMLRPTPQFAIHTPSVSPHSHPCTYGVHTHLICCSYIMILLLVHHLVPEAIGLREGSDVETPE